MDVVTQKDAREKDIGRWSQKLVMLPYTRVPRIASNHQKLPRDKKGFFPTTFRGNMALPNLNFIL